MLRGFLLILPAFRTLSVTTNIFIEDYCVSSPTAYLRCNEIKKEGDYFEIIPNDKWFEWAEKAKATPLENLVYDYEAIKRERHRREEARRDRDRQTAIENALRNSDLYLMRE